ncbi:uncharacterized protein BKA55DRAFT_257837 [Fusarium redolens]|uniref:Uncharacterized protein n=1 Tax=Fusarium redolens TaxID=48865 RepID=A0A9P9FVH6_FUSRE|nr:uncharacterized protein BKA55DRAFT_257837 [Fusarium redolens]KAH7210893.1 hypothetical protein BKA55DRAFT_257837 [Fusarium redolens]
MSTQPNSGEQSDVPAQLPRDVIEECEKKLESLPSKLRDIRGQLVMAEKTAKFWKSRHENLRQICIKREKSHIDLKKSKEGLIKANKDLKKALEDLRAENCQIRLEGNRVREERNDLEKRLHTLLARF